MKKTIIAVVVAVLVVAIGATSIFLVTAKESKQLTKEILNFSDLDLKCIFIHELNHYKYKHHMCYLLFGIIEKIHWFNPSGL